MQYILYTVGHRLREIKRESLRRFDRASKGTTNNYCCARELTSVVVLTRGSRGVRRAVALHGVADVGGAAEVDEVHVGAPLRVRGFHPEMVANRQGARRHTHACSSSVDVSLWKAP